jgi:alpha-1,2-mannosyltransferase
MRRVTPIRPAGWLALAGVLFLAAVAGYAWLISAFPHGSLQTDATVYRAAGLAVFGHPSELYSLRLGVAAQPFTYPPFAALVFAAASGLSFFTWQVALTVATIVLLPVVAYQALGIAGRPDGLPRLAGALAIAAVGLWLEPVMSTLAFGQINVLLLALVVGDLALPDRFRAKGIGIGLAAAMKLTPLIFVAYLLFTRRVRAAVVSALTFGASIGLGFVLLPGASAAFWRSQLSTGGNGQFHLLNQSINGAVLRLTRDGPHAHAYWLAAEIVVGIVGLGAAAVASRRGHELLGLVTCAATGLLLSPVSWSHHYVFVVPALVLAAYGPRRRGYRIASVAAVIALFGDWPMPIGGDGGFDRSAGWLPHGLLRLAPHYGPIGSARHELSWRGAELIAGNYYVVAALAFIAAVACALLLDRHDSLLAPPREHAARLDGGLTEDPDEVVPERRAAAGHGDDGGRARASGASAAPSARMANRSGRTGRGPPGPEANATAGARRGQVLRGTSGSPRG